MPPLSQGYKKSFNMPFYPECSGRIPFRVSVTGSGVSMVLGDLYQPLSPRPDLSGALLFCEGNSQAQNKKRERRAEKTPKS